jgi:hypothetical protein
MFVKDGSRWCITIRSTYDSLSIFPFVCSLRVASALLSPSDLGGHCFKHQFLSFCVLHVVK